jgi:hypothetical protein
MEILQLSLSMVNPPQLNTRLSSAQLLNSTERSHVPSFYNFGKDRVDITSSSPSTSISVCLFVVAETFVVSVATLWFPRLHFSFSYPWTRLFNTQRWFVFTNHIFAATCLSVRLLERPTCHNMYKMESNDFGISTRCHKQQQEMAKWMSLA